MSAAHSHHSYGVANGSSNIGDGKEFTDRLFGLRKRAATGKPGIESALRILNINGLKALIVTVTQHPYPRRCNCRHAPNTNSYREIKSARGGVVGLRHEESGAI